MLINLVGMEVGLFDIDLRRGQRHEATYIEQQALLSIYIWAKCNKLVFIIKSLNWKHNSRYMTLLQMISFNQCVKISFLKENTLNVASSKTIFLQTVQKQNNRDEGFGYEGDDWYENAYGLGILKYNCKVNGKQEPKEMDNNLDTIEHNYSTSEWKCLKNR